MTDRSPADEEIYRLATESDDTPPEPKAEEEPLELTEEVQKDEDEKPEEEKKTRSQRWEKRVDNLTARLREAERRAAEAEARTVPAQDNTPQAPDAYAKNPDGSDKYEFGEADPQYIKDAALFEVRKELAQEAKAKEESNKKAAEQTELTQRISQGMSEVEKTGAEKYDDFEKVIGEAVEARDGEPLHPLISIGAAVSPVGADVVYHLAKNEAEANRLEKLAGTNPQQAAVAFGEIEGQYVETDDDLNLADPMDMARMLGRMKSRLAGKRATVTEVKTTKAPNPAEHRARGAGGQFEVGDDTEDFAAFERKIMGK